MAHNFNGDAKLNVTYKVLSPKPIDDRSVVDSFDDLYKLHHPYEGMVVNVLGQGLYELKNLEKQQEKEGWELVGVNIDYSSLTEEEKRKLSIDGDKYALKNEIPSMDAYMKTADADDKYLTEETDPVWETEKDNYYTKDEVEGLLDKKQDSISDLEAITEGAILGKTAVQPEVGKGLFSGSYEDLTNKPNIPSTEGLLTKTDAEAKYQEKGYYLTEETDPTVPAWAKADSKPTYTAEEVGALPADTPLFSGDYNDLENRPEIPSIDGLLSEETADAKYQVKGTYLTEETDPVWETEKANYYTKVETEEKLSAKQNVIEDLNDIRENASSGKTLAQPCSAEGVGGLDGLMSRQDKYNLDTIVPWVQSQDSKLSLISQNHVDAQLIQSYKSMGYSGTVADTAVPTTGNIDDRPSGRRIPTRVTDDDETDEEFEEEGIEAEDLVFGATTTSGNTAKIEYVQGKINQAIQQVKQLLPKYPQLMELQYQILPTNISTSITQILWWPAHDENVNNFLKPKKGNATFEANKKTLEAQITELIKEFNYKIGESETQYYYDENKHIIRELPNMDAQIVPMYLTVYNGHDSAIYENTFTVATKYVTPDINECVSKSNAYNVPCYYLENKTGNLRWLKQYFSSAWKYVGVVKSAETSNANTVFKLYSMATLNNDNYQNEKDNTPATDIPDRGKWCLKDINDNNVKELYYNDGSSFVCRGEILGSFEENNYTYVAYQGIQPASITTTDELSTKILASFRLRVGNYFISFISGREKYLNLYLRDKGDQKVYYQAKMAFTANNKTYAPFAYLTKEEYDALPTRFKDYVYVNKQNAKEIVRFDAVWPESDDYFTLQQYYEALKDDEVMSINAIDFRIGLGISTYHYYPSLYDTYASVSINWTDSYSGTSGNKGIGIGFGNYAAPYKNKPLFLFNKEFTGEYPVKKLFVYDSTFAPQDPAYNLPKDEIAMYGDGRGDWANYLKVIFTDNHGVDHLFGVPNYQDGQGSKWRDIISKSENETFHIFINFGKESGSTAYKYSNRFDFNIAPRERYVTFTQNEIDANVNMYGDYMKTIQGSEQTYIPALVPNEDFNIQVTLDEDAPKEEYSKITWSILDDNEDVIASIGGNTSRTFTKMTDLPSNIDKIPLLDKNLIYYTYGSSSSPQVFYYDNEWKWENARELIDDSVVLYSKDKKFTFTKPKTSNKPEWSYTSSKATGTHANNDGVYFGKYHATATAALSYNGKSWTSQINNGAQGTQLDTSKQYYSEANSVEAYPVYVVHDDDADTWKRIFKNDDEYAEELDPTKQYWFIDSTYETNARFVSYRKLVHPSVAGLAKEITAYRQAFNLPGTLNISELFGGATDSDMMPRWAEAYKGEHFQVQFNKEYEEYIAGDANNGHIPYKGGYLDTTYFKTTRLPVDFEYPEQEYTLTEYNALSPSKKDELSKNGNKFTLKIEDDGDYHDDETKNTYVKVLPERGTLDNYGTWSARRDYWYVDGTGDNKDVKKAQTWGKVVLKEDETFDFYVNYDELRYSSFDETKDANGTPIWTPSKDATSTTYARLITPTDFVTKPEDRKKWVYFDGVDDQGNPKHKPYYDYILKTSVETSVGNYPAYTEFDKDDDTYKALVGPGKKYANETELAQNAWVNPPSIEVDDMILADDKKVSSLSIGLRPRYQVFNYSNGEWTEGIFEYSEGEKAWYDEEGNAGFYGDEGHTITKQPDGIELQWFKNYCHIDEDGNYVELRADRDSKYAQGSRFHLVKMTQLSTDNVIAMNTAKKYYGCQNKYEEHYEEPSEEYYSIYSYNGTKWVCTVSKYNKANIDPKIDVRMMSGQRYVYYNTDAYRVWSYDKESNTWGSKIVYVKPENGAIQLDENETYLINASTANNDLYSVFYLKEGTVKYCHSWLYKDARYQTIQHFLPEKAFKTSDTDVYTSQWGYNIVTRTFNNEYQLDFRDNFILGRTCETDKVTLTVKDSNYFNKYTRLCASIKSVDENKVLLRAQYNNELLPLTKTHEFYFDKHREFPRDASHYLTLRSESDNMGNGVSYYRYEIVSGTLIFDNNNAQLLQKYNELLVGDNLIKGYADMEKGFATMLDFTLNDLVVKSPDFFSCVLFNPLSKSATSAPKVDYNHIKINCRVSPQKHSGTGSISWENNSIPCTVSSVSASILNSTDFSVHVTLNIQDKASLTLTLKRSLGNKKDDVYKLNSSTPITLSKA